MTQTVPGVFISYSRTDVDFARELRDDLLLAGLPVWHDLKDIGAGQWWSQIDDAIAGGDGIEHVLLIVSPAALASGMVRLEWRLARREGKTILPVIPSKFKHTIDFTGLPEWMKAQHFFDLSQPEQQRKLVESLRRPGQQAKRPMMAPRLPEGFVDRTEEFTRLKLVLCNAQGGAVAITAALRGAGGFGKTVLASALARDEDIQEIFYDGVLWVTLGEKPSLIQIIAELIYELIAERTTFTEVNGAANRLKEVLEHRRCLLIIDDAWQQTHLQPFLDGALNTTRLITTRRDDILPSDAVKVVVDAMTVPEAVALLVTGIAEAGVVERAHLAKLATERLGEWPILLQLVNGFLRARVERGGALADAIGLVVERLDRRGLIAFDRTIESARNAAVEKTVGVALELLAEYDKAEHSEGYHGLRYVELAVFPEGAAIPIATIARLWGRTIGINHDQAEELLERFYGLALLEALDFRNRTIQLHDVMRRYLTERIGTDVLASLHRHIVSAYDLVSDRHFRIPDTFETASERRYFFDCIPMHLYESNQRQCLDALLLNPSWMQQKINTLQSPVPLIADYQRFAQEPFRAQWLVGRALELAATALIENPEELPAQLLSRLSPRDAPGLELCLVAAREALQSDNLVTLQPTLGPPGPEQRRIEYGIPLWRCTGLTDGSLAIIDVKRAIFVWHPDILGKPINRLSKNQFTLAMVPLQNGQLAFTNSQHVMVWDPQQPESPKVAAKLDNLSDYLAVLSNGNLLTANWTGELLIWSREPAIAPVRFTSSVKYITDIAALPGSRFVILGESGEIVLCNSLDDSSRMASREVGAKHFAPLPDNRLAVACDDQSLRVLDLEQPESLVWFGAHSSMITALSGLPDGRIVTGDENGFVHLWDCLKSTVELLGEHVGRVFDVTAMPDGRVASVGEDGVARVYELKIGARLSRSRAHSGRWECMAVRSGGDAALASDDGSVSLFSTQGEAMLQPLVTIGEPVAQVIALSDGDIFLGTKGRGFSEAARFTCWRDRERQEIEIFDGWPNEQYAATRLPNDRIAFGCSGGGVFLWEPDTPKTIRRIAAHVYGDCDGVAAMADGRVVSCGGSEILVTDPEDARGRSQRTYRRSRASLPLCHRTGLRRYRSR
jgi:WD40 repeat protein